jgi:two-component system chemotaxis sensor kinase CheA
MNELLEQFLIEGRDLVAQAAADFVTLSRDPAAAGAIDSAFRAVHTLKGSVGIFPMGPAERVLHAAEEVLERARKGVAPLDDQAVAALTACLDVVDRWIDQLERTGSVDDHAEAAGAAAIAQLPKLAGDGGKAQAASHEWVGALAEREAALIGAAAEPLVLFRYTPLGDCFFRGEDPLGIALAVPELLALKVLPASGTWPYLNAIEPFDCISVLEGVSSAGLDAVKAAFRLVSDQVELHALAPRTQASDMAQADVSRTLRVDAARIDALAEDLGEVLLAANTLAPIAEAAARIDPALAARIRAAQVEIESKTGKLRRSISRVRLVPLAPALRRLPRMVREIAGAVSREVTFSMSGETLEVDKQIADGVFEPLLHLLRNAIDHGIESTDARVNAGKPREGVVSLDIRRDGDTVHIVLSDDGAGIDPARLRAIAVARGLLTSDAAAELTDAAALRLIFAPGFSTAEALTEISGRGVGMDAVHSAIDKLRGTIEVESVLGRGTRFILRLPANALTTRLLVIEVGEDRYGIALDQIVETVRVGSDALVPIGGGIACVLRGKTVPVLDLAALLGGDGENGPIAKLLVTRSGGEHVALRVDGLAERLDTVVRPPSPMLAALPWVSGSAVLGDGGALIVLDLPELAA